jgi:hypothetical protein
MLNNLLVIFCFMLHEILIKKNAYFISITKREKSLINKDLFFNFTWITFKSVSIIYSKSVSHGKFIFYFLRKFKV